MAAAVDMLVPCAGSVDQEGTRREGRGGDGGGERMVAAVRAELQPLLPAPAPTETVLAGEAREAVQGAGAEATGAQAQG